MRSLLPLLLLLLVAAVVAVALVVLDEDPRAPDGPELAGAPTSAVPPAPRGGDAAAGAPASASAPPSPPGPAPTAEAFAGVRGLVVDERDRPVPGARVHAETLDTQVLRGAAARRGEVLAETAADRDGVFALGVPAGVGWMRVVARATGYGTAGIRVPGPTATVRLRLPGGASLEVHAIDERGGAVAGAEVTATAREAVLVARTGEDGWARLDGVAPGSVAVTVRAEGRGAARATAAVGGVGEVVRLQVVLAPAVLLAGRVIDAESTTPISDAEVHVVGAGYARAAPPTGPDGRFGPVPAGAPGERVLVAARAQGYQAALVPVDLPDADAPYALEIPLEAAAPWTGQVVDPGRRPVPGAHVTYTPDGVPGRTWPVAVTDKEGRFALPPPPPPVPGRRVVLVARGAGGHAALALRPGEPQPGDLVLVLDGGHRVTGRVVDAEGPRADVTVRLDPVWSEIADRRRPGAETSRLLAMNERGRLSLTTVPDGGGVWRLDGVPDGPYQVRVLSAEGMHWSEDAVVVAGADVDAGVVVLGRGHLLEGRAVGASGEPLPGVDVVVMSATRPPQVRRTVSEADGWWRVPDVPVGPYRVRGTRAGWHDGGAEVDVPAEEPVELVLVAGGRVTGRVLDAGEPFAGPFTITVEPRSARRARRALRRSFRDDAGRFVVEGVPLGEWRVRAEAHGGRVGLAPAPLEVRPGASYDLSIELAAGAALAGRLRTAAGRPVVGGRLVLAQEEGGRRRTVTTGTGGAWRLEGLTAGGWQVRASGPGGAPVEEGLVLAAGETRNLDLALAPSGSLVVRVLGPDGRARPGVYVGARPRDGPAGILPRAPRTDAEGLARLDDLPLGVVQLVARAPDGEVGRADAAVEPGAVRTVTLVVRPER